MLTLANPVLCAWLAWSRPFFVAWGYSASTLDSWARAPGNAALLENDLRQKALAATKALTPPRTKG